MEQILDQLEESTELRYAGFWLRVVAYLIDALIVGIIQAFVLWLGLGYNSYGGTDQLMLLVLTTCYFAYFESSDKQATWGKQVLGLKVVSLSGEQITFANALGRYFAKILSTLIAGIGFLMIAFTEKKQGLHDILASTLVIRA